MKVEAVSDRVAAVWVDGPDAEGFLQGLLSNDVAALTVGGFCDALLLDSTGHIRVDLRVARTTADGFTLVTAPESGGRLAELLEEYHFSEDVEILGPEDVDRVTFLGPVEVAGAELVLAGRVPQTVEAIGDASVILAGTAAITADPATLDAARVAAGVPRLGVDITDRTLVHEAGLEHTAVSFTKGCYLGQETVARVEYRGGVNRRLVGLRLDGAVERGAEVRVEGRLVGTVGSVVDHPALGPIALAVLRREAQVGGRVAIGADRAATVVALPFEDAPGD